MNTQHLIYRQASKVIDDAIATNLLLRNSDFAIKNRNAWGDRVYAKDMCTVKVSLGRNIGKTHYIHENMTVNDIAFFINQYPLQEYPERKKSMTKQVKSKKRVADHGEVFTAEREVNAMLDLVEQETERIDSRFLEPACGDGNFLAEILRRKLAVVKRKYKKSPIDYEKNAVLVAASIYGVDILQDNVDACRTRMFEIWDKEYKSVCKTESNEDCCKAVKFVFERNILCGDALSLKANDGKPIIFSEWAFITGAMIKRRDFRLDEMLEGHEEQMSIFMTNWEYDEEIKAFIPKPIKEFDPIHYRRVQDHGG